MKKILFVTDYAYLGGGEIVLLNLMRALRESDYSAVLIIPKIGPLFYEARNQSIDTRVIDMPPVGKKLAGYSLRFLDSLFKIRRVVKNEGISYIFANNLNAGIYASLVAKPFGIKSIWYCWGWYFPKNRFWQRIYRILFHRIVFCSQFVKEYMRINTFPPDEIPVLHPGIDVNHWSTDNAYFENLFKKENAIPRDCRIFSIIGRLDPCKNHNMFLNVANEIAKQYPKSYFVIAGAYNEDEGGDSRVKYDLEQNLKHMPALREKVLFTGFVKDIERITKASSIIFSCTGNGDIGESFGITIMEAMASGRPVIATSVGGPCETIIDDFNGFLVKPGDYKTMAKKALDLISSKSKYDSIIENARKCVLENYTLERFAKAIVDILCIPKRNKRG